MDLGLNRRFMYVGKIINNKDSSWTFIWILFSKIMTGIYILQHHFGWHGDVETFVRIQYPVASNKTDLQYTWTIVTV